MEMLKDICKKVVITAATTLTACIVKDQYDKYAHNKEERVKLKRKAGRLIPFKTNWY